MKENYTAFWEWVERHRETLGLSWREVEIRAGSGNGVLGRRARNHTRPTLQNLEALSEAFGLPLAELMRQAGFITSTDDREPTLQEIVELSQSLTTAERKELLRYIRFQYGGRLGGGAGK